MPPPTHTIEIFQCGHSTTHTPLRLLLGSPSSNQQHATQQSKKRAHATISRANAGPAPVPRQTPPSSPGRAGSTSYIAPDDDDDDDDDDESALGRGERGLVPRPLAGRGSGGGGGARTSFADSVGRERAGAVAWEVEEEKTLATAVKQGVRPVFVYLRGDCARGGCRGLAAERQGRGAYDGFDAEDLRDLWENLFGLAVRAVVGVAGARDAAADPEGGKRRDADDVAVRQRCRPATAKVPLGHRRRSGPVHSSVRHLRGSCRARRDAAALTGLYGQLRVVRETEVGSLFEVTAGRHHLLGPSRLIQLVLSDVEHFDAETAAGQLLAAVIWLEQAELLRATRAPKGWFEACIQRAVGELEGAEEIVGALEELRRT